MKDRGDEVRASLRRKGPQAPDRRRREREEYPYVSVYWRCCRTQRDRPSATPGRRPCM